MGNTVTGKWRPKEAEAVGESMGQESVAMAPGFRPPRSPAMGA